MIFAGFMSLCALMPFEYAYSIPWQNWIAQRRLCERSGGLYLRYPSRELKPSSSGAMYSIAIKSLPEILSTKYAMIRYGCLSIFIQILASFLNLSCASLSFRYSSLNVFNAKADFILWE